MPWDWLDIKLGNNFSHIWRETISAWVLRSHGLDGHLPLIIFCTGKKRAVIFKKRESDGTKVYNGILKSLPELSRILHHEHVLAKKAWIMWNRPEVDPGFQITQADHVEISYGSSISLLSNLHTNHAYNVTVSWSLGIDLSLFCISCKTKSKRTGIRGAEIVDYGPQLPKFWHKVPDSDFSELSSKW